MERLAGTGVANHSRPARPCMQGDSGFPKFKGVTLEMIPLILAFSIFLFDIFWVVLKERANIGKQFRSAKFVGDD